MEIEIIEEEKLSKRKKQAVEVKPVSKSYYDTENISYFTNDEYSTLIDNADRFYKLLYLLLFEIGARVEEVRGVRC